MQTPGSELRTDARPLFEQNLSILLERDPFLAGQVQGHPDYLRFRSGSFPPYTPEEPEAVTRLLQPANAPVPERATVLLGIGEAALGLRQLGPHGMILVVEPDLTHFVGFMARFPVLPLLLRCRLLIAQSPELVCEVLSGFGTLTILAHPGRLPHIIAFSQALELELFRRVAHVRAVQQQNTAQTLLTKLTPDEPLALFLQRLPPEQVLDPGSLESFIEQNVKKWGRVERLFVTLNCFR